MTVGSSNLEKNSMERHTEINVVCWDAGVAAALRRDLFEEHGEQQLHRLDPAGYAAISGSS
jgi:phosphatidylserine/phosphatidylglycerophosphate/cardiolipin synthase-like enzyme